MDKQEILRKLKTSLEVSTIRLWIMVELGMVLLVIVLHYLASMGDSWEVTPWAFYGGIVAIALLPIFGVHGWELWRIFRKAEACRFYQVKLTHPSSHFWARAMYFTLLLQDKEGSILTRTHSIFATHSQIGPSMEEYLNKTVTVAYNGETGEVVVIG